MIVEIKCVDCKQCFHFERESNGLVCDSELERMTRNHGWVWLESRGQALCQSCKLKRMGYPYVLVHGRVTEEKCNFGIFHKM